MKELYILRHGIAVEPGTPGIPDDERPLTAKGEKRMREIARGLRRLDLKLDRHRHQPAAPSPRDRRDRRRRARCRRPAGNRRRSSRPAPMRQSIQSWLRERTEDRLMIVGHNPALSDLITLLVLGKRQSGPPVCDLKKGGIAALGPSAAAPDRFDLLWIATPRLIRRLADGRDR